MKKTITLLCFCICFLTYSSYSQQWLSMASGLGVSSEEVKAIAVDPNGNVYVGGTFTGSINYLAVWNGSSWTSPSGGVNGPVYSIGIRTASDIYVGGLFTTAGTATVSNIAHYNGSTWSAAGNGLNGKVLCVYTPGSGAIYAAGEFSMSGTTNMIHIAQYQSGAWVPMGGGIPANVNAIVEHNGTVYAGCDQSTNPVMKWNGSTWSAVSGLTGGKVSALASFGGMLYAGGDFSTPIRALAKFDGTTWNTAITNFNFNQHVNVLLSRPNGLYVGGNFTNIGIGNPNYVAKVPNISAPLIAITSGSELTNGEVFALGMAAGKLIAGGKFTTPTAPATFNVAITSTIVNVDQLNDVVINKTLYPNPVHGSTTLSVSTSGSLENAELKIFDAQGKLINTEITSEQNNSEAQFHINLESVPVGNYYYVLTEKGQLISSDNFIIE